MVGAGRTAAGWLAGRVLLFALALAVLVLAGIAADRGSTLRSRFDALIPDAELARSLAAQQADLRQSVQQALDRSNAFLQTAHVQSRETLARRAAELDAQVQERKARRPGAAQQALAFATGQGAREAVENEVMIQLLAAERDQVIQLLGAMERIGTDPATARATLAAAAADHQQKHARYTRLDAELNAYGARNPLALVPFEMAGVANETRTQYLALFEARNRAVRDHNAASARLQQARKSVALADARKVAPAASLPWPESPWLAQFDQLVAQKTAQVELARQQFAELGDRFRRTVWQAFWLVVAISLTPLLLKAFWYYLMAPLAARRPPIQLQPAGTPAAAWSEVSPAGTTATKISAVSQEIVLQSGDELLVHPEYIQSLPHDASKRTQWLLTRRLPFTSLASGMVALTRVTGAGAVCVVASKRDPFAELAVIDVPAGGALVLQPRSLAGVVQRAGAPVRIEPRWRLSLGALITLQFRYLVFEGPLRLIVAGGRGIRQERAGQGRSIDQNQTIGFSANLAYSPRRSETFGAYLLGVNGLFNDSFAGGPGIYVFEEMPYLGRRGGLTGRGLQGVTDVLLKFLGI
jgi:uncharacterized protein (AIM24 family)